MVKILDSEGKKFPKRKNNQPIFYPVLTYKYACKIAKEWNTKDIDSGFAGYVTEFIIDDSFLEEKRYEIHCVGTKDDLEIWVPSNELDQFNQNIIGKIKIVESFYGSNYKGILPLGVCGFHESNLDKQIKLLERIYNYNSLDFSGTVFVEWKIINLNLQYWSLNKNNHDIVNTMIETLKKNNKLFIKVE